jgi:hypothetical protein
MCDLLGVDNGPDYVPTLDEEETIEEEQSLEEAG